MSNIPYNLTDKTLTIIIDGAPQSVDRNSHVVAELREILAEDSPDLDRLRLLLSPAKALAEKLDGSGVQVVGNTVTYKGHRIASHLEARLIDIASWGLDVTPWKRFVERVFANPLESARLELNLFLENADLPITPDGCFLAYKRVSGDYKDLHSHTFDNSVGTVVSMPRSEVDTDRYRTCSRGLHFCAQGYLRSFGSGGDNRIVIVKIDPADVVSIPSDYSNMKGRTWRYEVVGEIELADETEKVKWGVIEDRYQSVAIDYDDDEDEEWGWPDDDEDDEQDEVPADVPVVEATAFVSPGSPTVSFWRKARLAVDRFR